MADEHEPRRNGSSVSSKRKSRHRSRSNSEEIDRSKKKSSKQKLGKRSHSSDTSSSSEGVQRETKAEKKVKKKKKRRYSSSDSSSSGSDDKHAKSRSRKKHKKDKKTKKKKRKSKKEGGNVGGAVDQNKYGAYGIIRESDLFVKQQEFYAWLYEVKQINPETLPKFETKKMFETYMEDYNTATLPHKKYYDLEKWEARRLQKSELKALKKARETSFSVADDEKRHDFLHRKTAGNKHATPSRQQLLEMQQELRRRQDEEYKKKAGLS